jgi:hypothetical protein
MAEMGRYCKAYHARSFRQYGGWVENQEGLRQTQEGARRELGDEDVLYLQEDLTVTDGIFKGDHVVFDRVTPEWREFCAGELGFEAPEDAWGPQTESHDVAASAG